MWTATIFSYLFDGCVLYIFLTLESSELVALVIVCADCMRSMTITSPIVKPVSVPRRPQATLDTDIGVLSAFTDFGAMPV